MKNYKKNNKKSILLLATIMGSVLLSQNAFGSTVLKSGGSATSRSNDRGSAPNNNGGGKNSKTTNPSLQKILEDMFYTNSGNSKNIPMPGSAEANALGALRTLTMGQDNAITPFGQALVDTCSNGAGATERAVLKEALMNPSHSAVAVSALSRALQAPVDPKKVLSTITSVGKTDISRLFWLFDLTEGLKRVAVMGPSVADLWKKTEQSKGAVLAYMDTIYKALNCTSPADSAWCDFMGHFFAPQNSALYHYTIKDLENLSTKLKVNSAYLTSSTLKRKFLSQFVGFVQKSKDKNYQDLLLAVFSQIQNDTRETNKFIDYINVGKFSTAASYYKFNVKF